MAVGTLDARVTGATAQFARQDTVERGRELLGTFAEASYGMPLEQLEQIQALAAGPPDVVAEKLREVCAARAMPHPASDVAPNITISLGVAARVPDENNNADALVIDADAALYTAKRAGRNRVSVAAHALRQAVRGE